MEENIDRIWSGIMMNGWSRIKFRAKINEILTEPFQQENERLKGLVKAFPDGMGDYEWKLVENFNSKNHRINELEEETKRLTLKWTRASFNEMNDSTRAYINQLEDGMKEAIELIMYWHDFPHPEPEKEMMHNTYLQSPEMKRLIKLKTK